MNKSAPKQSRPLLRQMIWKMMKLRDIKQILTSLGEVSECLGDNEEREVRHASLELLQMENCLILVIWIDITLENMKWITIPYSAISKPPTWPTYLAFSLLFGLGALELANPAFQLFFWLSSYLNIPLFLLGLRLSCWAPKILYLSTNLPRLISLDRCLFSIF